MQLKASTDLALRIVMRLAVLDDDEVTATNVLAEQLHVNAAHASKVVTTLGHLGVVETRRGRHGGLRLAPGALSTSVGHLARFFEGGQEPVECDGANPCPLRGACRLRGALARAQEAFFAALDPITLESVVAPPTRSLLLGLPGGAPA